MAWRLLAVVASLFAGVAQAQDAGLALSPDAGVVAPLPAPVGPQPQVIIVPAPVAAPAPAAEPAPPPEPRIRYFFVTAEGGVGRVDLHTVAQDGTVIGTRNTGIFGGLRLGFTFLKFLALAVEGRLHHYLATDATQAFDTVVAVAMLQGHVPLGPARLFAELGGGFAYVGAFVGCTIGGDCPVSSKGYTFHAGAGLDFQIAEPFSIGGMFVADTLNSGPFGLAGSSASQVMNPGDSAGVQYGLLARVNLHL